MGARRYTRTSVEYSEITSGTILDWTQDATWMFWVRPTTAPAFTIFGVASAWNSSADWWRLRCTDLITGNDDLILEVNGDSSGTSAEGTAVLSAGTWSHIAIVRSGTTWTVYVGGVSDITFSKDLNGTPSKIIEGNTYDPNTSGAAHTSDSFDGRFAASKAWQAALTAQEIRSEMKRVHPVRLANLHEFWPAENDTRKFSGRAKGINWTGVNTPTYEEGPPLQIRGIQPLVILPVSTGITGTVAATIAGVTSAASGAETFTGTSAATIATPTSAASGTETFTGSASATVAGVTSAASGTETFTGTVAATLAGVTSSAAGTETFTGTASPTISGITSTAAGTETFTGTCSATVAAVTCAASGTVTAGITGTVAATIAGVTSTATGTETFSGSCAATIAAVTCAASGVNGADNFGSCAATIDAVVCTAAGLVMVETNPTVLSGTLDISATLTGTLDVSRTLTG